MFVPIDSTYYSLEERQMFELLKQFFHINSTCMECVQKLLPAWFTETYVSTDSTIGDTTYNIKLARQIIATGEFDILQLTPHDLRSMPKANVIHYDPRHIPHIPAVQLAQPGIIVTHYVNGHDEHLLIDGSHRAASCMLNNAPFYAYLLSRDATQRVLWTADDIRAAEQRLIASGFMTFAQNVMSSIV